MRWIFTNENEEVLFEFTQLTEEETIKDMFEKLKTFKDRKAISFTIQFREDRVSASSIMDDIEDFDSIEQITIKIK